MVSARYEKLLVTIGQTAKEMGIRVFGFLGSGGGRAFELCDLAFVVPSDDTGRIQESHILVGHIICQLIEEELF